MKRLMIDKFIDDVHQERIKVPLFVVKILCIILPEKGKAILSDMSFDLHGIIEAGQNKMKFKKTIDVTEHDVLKKIVLSIE